MTQSCARLTGFCALLIAFATSGACAAAEIPDRDAQAIRAVITAQLDAFAQDDAARAFSYATSGIRAQFGSADAFIAMVRTTYPVVYRNRSVQFESARSIDGEIIQPVRLTDIEGRAWLALYPMRRDADGSWRINGCQLARAPGVST